MTPEMSEMIKICNQKRVLGESEKAICVDIGRTFSGVPIITWYPKSACLIKPTQDGYELWAPVWTNTKRVCTLGKFRVNETKQGFRSASDFFNGPF